MAPRFKLLVSNDDGIKAPGIVALVRELQATNLFDITVVAPAGERSAQAGALEALCQLRAAVERAANAASWKQLNCMLSMSAPHHAHSTRALNDPFPSTDALYDFIAPLGLMLPS